jgi:hypothetical protein
MQMLSQMNGCHVLMQVRALQNPAYRPTGDFSFYGFLNASISGRALFQKPGPQHFQIITCVSCCVACDIMLPILGPGKAVASVSLQGKAANMVPRSASFLTFH